MRGGARPDFGAGSSRDIFSDTASIGSSRPGHKGGSVNETWYLDYFDPSFIENPWHMLEKAKGLEPAGGWGEERRVYESKKILGEKDMSP